MSKHLSDLTHQEYITLHPKLELHAHISGSISETHLVSLIKQHWPDPQDYEEKLNICKLSPDNHHDTRNLDECFALFKVLHHIINNKDIIHMVTLQVLEDFVFRDHCVYIELRTTPRPIKDDNGNVVVTMHEYMNTVCNAIKEFRMIIAFLADKYSIKTILDDNNIKIPFYESIEQYSTYGQQIITRFDKVFVQNTTILPPTEPLIDTNTSTTTLTLNINDNSIPFPSTSPLSPQIDQDFIKRCQNNTIAPHNHPHIAHYHSNEYTLSSVALAISSFVSAGILFSIDRASFSTENCQELLSTINQLRTKDTIQSDSNIIQPNTNNEIILGLDFSGNPFAKNTFNAFLPFWTQCDAANLFTSIHFAETTNDQDSNDILSYQPHRLGHAAVLDSKMRERILSKVEKHSTVGGKTFERSKMGIEVCLSSNKACKLHTTINTHPIVGWIEHNNQIVREFCMENYAKNDQNGDKKDQNNDDNDKNSTIFPSLSSFPSTLHAQIVPITLCTDDSGVFSCSLVDEWLQLLNLSYFNFHLENNNCQNNCENNSATSSPLHRGQYTIPIDSLKDENKQIISITPNQHIGVDGKVIPRSKIDDLVRINNFSQSGIFSIFQRNYIHVIQQVFERFRPVG